VGEVCMEMRTGTGNWNIFKVTFCNIEELVNRLGLDPSTMSNLFEIFSQCQKISQITKRKSHRIGLVVQVLVRITNVDIYL